MELDDKFYNVDFSIIIPQRDSIHTLKRLIDTIPNKEEIEIIVVDNTPNPVTKEDIGVNRSFHLLWSSPNRHAGGARNEGMKVAKGKWLVFADADDYFTPDAFDVFYSQFDSTSDVIFFKSLGIIPETGESSNHNEPYNKMIADFLRNKEDIPLRLRFLVPWAKMVRRSFVMEKGFTFDEVRASNDVFFSTLIGFYAKTISAFDKEVYVYTVSRGSLTKRRDFEVLHSRYLVTLRRNKFLKDKGLGKYQVQVLSFLYEGMKIGVPKLLLMLKESIQFKQNIFVEFSHIFLGSIKYLKSEKDNSRYIVK